MKRIYEYEDLQPVLEQLLNEKESSDLEFKSAKGGFPHSFWETYSSFANTDGGAIVFGIKEKDDQFFLDGLTEEQARKYEKDFFNRMHSKVEKLNVFRKDRKTGEYGLTYAGLLMFGTYKADITKMLGQMCAARLLESSGHGRGTKYHVYGFNFALPDANVGLPDANVVLPKPNMGLPDANVALNMGLSDANMGLSDANMGLPDANMGLPDANMGLPNANMGLNKKRYSKEEMRNLVVDFCYEWRTAEEIAAVVGRKFRYVRDIILPQLSDVIEKMYDIPHHPRQKYRAKQKEADA